MHEYNIISPTPISPTNIPNLCQEFEHPFYITKRPPNIITYHSQKQIKRPLSSVQELDFKNTRDKILRRDQSLELEEAKNYIRSLSF